MATTPKASKPTPKNPASTAPAAEESTKKVVVTKVSTPAAPAAEESTTETEESTRADNRPWWILLVVLVLLALLGAVAYGWYGWQQQQIAAIQAGPQGPAGSVGAVGPAGPQASVVSPTVASAEPAAPVPAVAAASVPPTASTSTYPALTDTIVAPWIAKMGSGGHPGHDVVGNTQCAYWLDPKYLIFADDTGPDTSGVETATEGVFTFDLAGIARYKSVPADTVFVAEAAWASYKGAEYKQSFLITTDRDTIDLSGAAIFALPNPASVGPFIALRQAHITCRGYQDSIVDFRSGSPVVTFIAPSTDALASSSAPAATAMPPAATAVPGVKPSPTVLPASSGVNATYSFGSLTGTANKAECVELKGANGMLNVDLKSGGIATSGRVDASTDWLLAKSSGVGKYATQWAGWLLCFDTSVDQAVASLIATDGNAENNKPITWQPAK
jgi:hypothetical protein